MKRQPVQILHAFPSGRHYWVQIRHRRSREAEALLLAARRAVTAGWEPWTGCRVETTSQSKNWLTRELWYAQLLTLPTLLQLSAANLESEQSLVQFDADRLRRMVETRQAYDARTNPLFAAMGALDEVCASRTVMGYLMDHFQGESGQYGGDIGREQEAHQLRQEAARRLDAATHAELAEYCARTYPDAAGFRLSFWRDVIHNPEKRLAQIRQLRDLRARAGLPRYPEHQP